MENLEKERDVLKRKAETAARVPELLRKKEELATQNSGLKAQVSLLKRKLKTAEELVKKSRDEKDEALAFKQRSGKEGAEFAMRVFKNANEQVRVMNLELCNLSIPKVGFVVKDEKIWKPVKGGELEQIFPRPAPLGPEQS